MSWSTLRRSGLTFVKPVPIDDVRWEECLAWVAKMDWPFPGDRRARLARAQADADDENEKKRRGTTTATACTCSTKGCLPTFQENSLMLDDFKGERCKGSSLFARLQAPSFHLLQLAVCNFPLVVPGLTSLGTAGARLPPSRGFTWSLQKFRARVDALSRPSRGPSSDVCMPRPEACE